LPGIDQNFDDPETLWQISVSFGDSFYEEMVLDRASNTRDDIDYILPPAGGAVCDLCALKQIVIRSI
jgi:hypothetical protein